MPKPGEDKYFGGKPGAAQRAWEGMVKTYGKDAEHVYKARIAKLRKRGKR